MDLRLWSWGLGFSGFESRLRLQGLNAGSSGLDLRPYEEAKLPTIIRSSQRTTELLLKSPGPWNTGKPCMRKFILYLPLNNSGTKLQQEIKHRMKCHLTEIVGCR